MERKRPEIYIGKMINAYKISVGNTYRRNRRAVRDFDIEEE
jgi:hypothetical protein